MKLFFGTDLYELVDIINDKKISTEKFGCWTCDTDILLEKYLGKEFVSKKSINLSDDEEFIFIGYEYYIDIDTNDLDTDKLFVGNRHLRLDIQDAKSEEEALSMAKKYKDSFIPFKEYLKNPLEYDCTHMSKTEMLYFGDIDVSSHLEDNKEAVLALFKKNWMSKHDYKELISDFLK